MTQKASRRKIKMISLTFLEHSPCVFKHCNRQQGPCTYGRPCPCHFTFQQTCRCWAPSDINVAVSSEISASAYSDVSAAAPLHTTLSAPPNISAPAQSDACTLPVSVQSDASALPVPLSSQMLAPTLPPMSSQMLAPFLLHLPSQILAPSLCTCPVRY